MKPDMQGLEITKGELRRLIGFAPRHILVPFWGRVIWLSLWYFAVDYIAIAIFSLILSAFTPLGLTWQAHLWISIILGIGTAAFQRWQWLQENAAPALRNLLNDVQQFNSMVKAIHINDQLEDAGNTSVAISDRDKVMQALRLAREDLVRALKTERILRENKTFIANRPALFTSNVAALSALQVSDRASEHGRLLNEALQIAVSTQEEMQRLQDS